MELFLLGAFAGWVHPGTQSKNGWVAVRYFSCGFLQIEPVFREMISRAHDSVHPFFVCLFFIESIP